MKIIRTRKIKGYQVDTNENQYIRYGSDCWFITIGDSDEPLYNCKEIERLFQEYMAKS